MRSDAQLGTEASEVGTRRKNQKSKGNQTTVYGQKRQASELVSTCSSPRFHSEA